MQRAVAATARYLEDGGVAALEAAPAAAAARTPTTTRSRVVERVRAAGGTVVATGGCFDLIHAGHARTLSAARALGDCLIVLLNSDDSVRRLEGPGAAADDRSTTASTCSARSRSSTASSSSARTPPSRRSAASGPTSG